MEQVEEIVAVKRLMDAKLWEEINWSWRENIVLGSVMHYIFQNTVGWEFFANKIFHQLNLAWFYFHHYDHSTK